ncbi:hypothetical protein CE195_03265 [Sodalis-like symbiont of Philaenus spumarius]|nr:hypothetical protein CE195_03265 [Sodalis-like symbiont of Philaenus spumarius]
MTKANYLKALPTQCIERNNLTLRTRIKRLGSRKPLLCVQS